jgi:hypothetical protein
MNNADKNRVRTVLHLMNIPSGKHTKNDRKSPALIGKSTISMGHFQ